MKFATATLLLATAFSASATSIRSGSAARSLLSAARKLEDQQNQEEEQQEEDEFQFLSNYSLKLIGCSAGEKYKNPENGEYESSSVIFRLCPATECDSDTAFGCKSGYGDFVVGINTFTEAWLEDKREDMQQDDAFQVEEYGECRQYEVDQDNDDEDAEEQAVYYVGPACGDDGASIKLGFFADYLCSTEPEDVTFEDISNGWTLPYSSGLVTSACEDCAGYNDNGEYELGEVCMRLYEDSGKCEEHMEYTGMYGAQTGSCEYIETISPAAKVGGGAGKVFGWILFFLILGGIAFYGYSVWWRKRKSGAGSDGLMN